MNEKIRLEDLTPHIRTWAMESDGIEVYCLYILILVSILLSFFILSVYRILLSHYDSSVCKMSYWFLLFSLILNAGLFFGNIGFYPPMFSAVLNFWNYLLVAVMSVVAYYLFKASTRFGKISNLVVPVVLFPFCFVATMPISIVDYSYIFSPALRMIHHFNLSEIYFQYDLLLSLLAALWMKLDINLNYFQVLGQISLYLFLLFSFFLSKRLFLRKDLSYYLLAVLVLVKIYANFADPVFHFQTTPLRLDWWLLLVILTYEKGVYSKYIGLALGMLIVLHRTFGMIYAVCYLETVIFLMLVDLMKDIIHGNPLKSNLKKHLRHSIVNLSVIALSSGLSALMFGASLESASIYQKIGIGFLPISKISFYWYVPVVLSAASIYLLKLRSKLPEGYFTAGSFLILLSVGNSIYFFGRSHENNIINISGSLIFALFMLFDLLSFKYTCPKGNRTFTRLSIVFLPNILLLLLLFYYSERIYTVSEHKLNNMKKLQFIYPMPYSFDSKQISELTKGSPNVYFVGKDDFYYYYYGGYVPRGRFSPYGAWIYKKELVDFMQVLLDKGYYIVLLKERNPGPDMYGEVLSALKYNKIIEKDGYKVFLK